MTSNVAGMGELPDFSITLPIFPFCLASPIGLAWKMERWELVMLPVEVCLQATELSREALMAYSGGKEEITSTII